MKSRLQQGFTLIELLVVITIIALIAGMALPAYNGIRDKANQMAGQGNCRQIIMSLKSYAADNGGGYPDSDSSEPQSANDAFRVLFKDGQLEDERIFGCPASIYKPNNIVGEAPEYSEALEPGENHWALTMNMTDSASGIMPIVFEDPETTAWPPSWNADAAGQLQPGRAWKGGRIIIGLNDNSVNVERLEASKGSNVGPKDDSSGKNVFTRASEQGEVLDVMGK